MVAFKLRLSTITFCRSCRSSGKSRITSSRFEENFFFSITNWGNHYKFINDEIARSDSNAKNANSKIKRPNPCHGLPRPVQRYDTNIWATNSKRGLRKQLSADTLKIIVISHPSEISSKTYKTCCLLSYSTG